MKLIKPDKNTICGNCEKRYSEHYFENEVFCFLNTTSDIFTDEPNESIVLNMIINKYPSLYDKCVSEWKINNGH